MPPELPRWRVSVASDDLTELRRRLRATRWPDDVDPDDDYYGTPIRYLRELAEYWADEFDWAAAEESLNAFRHHRMEIAGVPVHFIYERGVGPDPIPIVLSHGWPWTFWDWQKVIGPLTDPARFGGDPGDAFDVVVPSLPGFGFSTPLGRSDMTFWRAADLWHELMTTTLGYSRYAAGGCDFGALVTGQLGHKYAEHLYGIYLGHAIHLDLFQGERPWDITGYTGGAALPDGLDADTRAALLRYRERLVPHVAVHMLDGRDLSYGLSDSPVGLLAWILRRWQRWSDCDGDVESVFPREHMMTNATMWWATGTIASSIQWYANTRRYPWTPSHSRIPIVEAPMGMSFLGGENPPGLATDKRIDAFMNNPDQLTWYRPVHLGAHEVGGHFGPWENPEAVVSDIRETFRQLR
jgi:pimeloyl-ACP methyl ester carboxylesterase